MSNNMFKLSKDASSYTSYNIVDEVVKYIKEENNAIYIHNPLDQYNNYGQYQNIPRINPVEIESAIHHILTNPKLLAHILTDSYNIKLIIEMMDEEDKRNMKELNQIQNKHNERYNNGIDHAEYDEAVDIIEILEEVGITNFDEEQRENYDMAMEIVKQYEEN